MDESLYQVEETKRQKHEVQKVKGKGRDNEHTLRARRLEKAQEQQAVPTRAMLEALASHSYDHPVMSMYLRITPDTTLGTPKTYLHIYNVLKEELVKSTLPYMKNLSHFERKSMLADLAKIASFIDYDFTADGTKTLIIFRSGKELNRLIRLPVLLPDLLTVNPHPVVEPLIQALETHQKILGVIARKETAEFFIYELGTITSIDTMKNFVPTNTVDASRPNKVQRHRLNFLSRHLREVVAATKEHCRARNCESIVLFTADEKMRNEIVTYMDAPLRTHVLTTGILSPEHQAHTITDTIEAALAARQAAIQDELIEKLPLYASTGQVISGIRAVISGMNRFLVRAIAVDERIAEPGYTCPKGHYISLAPGACPSCEQTLLPANNILIALSEMARKYNVTTIPITHHPESLVSHGGIVALTVPLSPTRITVPPEIFQTA